MLQDQMGDNNKTLMNKDDVLDFLVAKNSEWGKLENKKPTHFARDLIKNGVDLSVIKEHLMKNFEVSEKNANLVYQTLRNQKTIIRNDNLINLHITFNAEKDNVEKYLNDLKKEIIATKQIVSSKSYIVRSIYIEGDIFANLTPAQIDMLLSEIAYPVSEYTVETNNFEEITEEKLLVLKNYGVNRIVLNPQTFMVKTIKFLENNPTKENVFAAYMLGLKHDFLIDMNFVVGLGGETLANFKKTITLAKELSPQNITISLNKNLTSAEHIQEVNQMQTFALSELASSGYRPYYFIKNSENHILEKVGFAVDGKVSLFNIDNAEDTLSVLACGVGAVNKKIASGKVETIQNPKTFEEYTKNLDQAIKSKQEMF